MKIEKENIESFIFDYHEGNLSDSEKTDVLNYIHTHPEYEVAFTQLAQSYLPHEPAVKNYGLTNNLLQTPSTSWYNKSWIKITAPIALVGFILFFYLIAQESTSNSTPPPTTKSKQPSIDETKAHTTTALNSIDINKTEQKQTSNVVSNSLIKNNSLPRTHSTIETATSSTSIETSPTSDINTPKNVQENKKQVSDSITTTTNVIESNKKVDENKKKKSYKIKPTTDFIPTNPNF